MSYETVTALATSHCPLQDAAGTGDIVDNNRANATWNGEARTVTTGPTSWLPSAITFSGTNYADTGYIPDSRFNRDGSGAIWMRQTGGRGVSRYMQSTRWGNYGFISRLEGSGTYRTMYGNASSLSSATSTFISTLDEWAHLGWTKSGTTVKMYVNGVQVDSDFTITAGAIDYATDLAATYCIGAQGDGGAGWVGDLADALFWENQVLTADQMLAVYTGPTTSSDNNALVQPAAVSLFKPSFKSLGL